MMLGYCAGTIFAPKFTGQQRQKTLTWMGLGLILLFFTLRFSNIYGDPVKWTEQKNGLYTFFSFIKTNKYPPSLLYLLMTIGPSMLLLAFFENVKNRFTNIMLI